MTKLLQEFKEMRALPLFELCYEDYGIKSDDEYELYTIEADTEGLSTTGLHEVLRVDWDDTFSLDEHLQALYELCIEDMSH